jgi:hypothetical protein
MSISFKWSVHRVRVIPTQGEKTNLVTSVDWFCQAFDDVNNITTSAAGTRELTAGDGFIPYDQLTEQQVLDWCFAPEVITWTDTNNVEQTITKHLKDEGEAQVTGQIERQLAQKAAEPALPWVTSVGN